MSLVKRNENGLFPSFDTLWDDLLGHDFFKKRFELGTSMPAVNMKETDDEYLLEAALPGLKREDIQVDVERGVMTIQSSSKADKEEKDGERVTRKEYSYSSFSRKFTMPENAVEEQITASYENGILNIRIPKKQGDTNQSKRSIDIR